MRTFFSWLEINIERLNPVQIFDELEAVYNMFFAVVYKLDNPELHPTVNWTDSQHDAWRSLTRAYELHCIDEKNGLRGDHPWSIVTPDAWPITPGTWDALRKLLKANSELFSGKKALGEVMDKFFATRMLIGGSC